MSSKYDPGLLHRIEEALLRLPRTQREIFLAVRCEDLSYEEIGRRTGLGAKQVERQFARALYKIDKQFHGGRLSWWERWF